MPSDPAGPPAGPPPRLRSAARTTACLLVLAAGVALVAWILAELAAVTLAIVVALLMTALIEPVARLLRRFRLPPWLAALGGLLTILVIVALPLWLIVDRLARQWSELTTALRGGVERLGSWLVDGPLPVTDEQLRSLGANLRETALDSAPRLLSRASTVTQVVTGALTAFVLLFFLLKDGPGMWDWIVRRTPAAHRDRVRAGGQAGWTTLTAYIRGELVIALVDAAGIGLALVLVGVPLAVPLAALTFIAAFVPIVGALASGAVAVLITLVGNGLGDAILVLVAIIAVQQIEGNLLQPVIIGRALDLHGAVVLVAVTAGTLVAGIAGAVLAVPLLAVCYRVTLVLTGERTPDGGVP
ncbi:AI-2E family transporter [Actinomadura parmotrematis]|uniref:AI-2E family transporter n=1 Tax=Actinomadura parmotrematis TaxID=2864039 RepID=A0ABS7FNA9_9ACTN|nr:AI-2E family transporter [Actinomadura parmotrematis]MBW8481878.1 AI-2E family transporter [Actinomadura parmotrematis]